ncbi:MAG: adenine deaminase C-terminal domain-containing protein [Pseudomonadota bacterium]
MNATSSYFRDIPLTSLIRVASGQEDADLAILNAGIVNVYSGEILDNCSVGIKGEWIAWVGDAPKNVDEAHTRVIDAGGKTVIPGLIDGHTHMAWLTNPADFLETVMKGGTTTLITETMETYPIRGSDGVKDFLAALQNQPIKIFTTAPAMASISGKTKGMPVEVLTDLLNQEGMVGLGESYWQAVIQEPGIFLPMFGRTLASGKLLEGHSAGASGKKLMAYVASGVSSCHEPISADEVLSRLRLGLYVMIREGSIRRDLVAISKIRDFGIDFRRLILVTDGATPEDLLHKGYMEFVVQKAIDCGFDPVTAIQMATLNVAEHFGLDALVGGIAPAKHADMLIIPDPASIIPEIVISRGKVVAENGQALVHSRRHVFSKQSLASVHIPEPLKPADFTIRSPEDSPFVRVRIIDLITELVTQELEMEMPVAGGEIQADTGKDIIKVAAIDRVHEPGKRFVGLIQGTGMKSGAFASSAAWDSSDIIVVGASDADMAIAVNRIREMQGGAVVCDGQKVLAELALPVMGIMADIPLAEMARQLDAIRTAIAGLGVHFSDPLLTLVTLTGAAIPYLRICDEGLVNLKNGKTTGLWI